MELSTTILDDTGLISCIERLCQEFEKEHAIHVQFHHPASDPILERNIAEGVFHIVYAALNNVVNNTKAKYVQLSLLQENENLILTFVDDGKFESLFDLHIPMEFIAISDEVLQLSGAFNTMRKSTEENLLIVSIPLKHEN